MKFVIVLLILCGRAIIGVGQMNSLEQNMFDEINLFRANPAKYADRIDSAYAQMIRVNVYITADHLALKERVTDTLRQTSTLGTLTFRSDLYTAATIHGKALKNADHFYHSKYTSGAENWVQGVEPAHWALALLIIDYGIAGAGHRVNLMDKALKYLACKYVPKNRIGKQHIYIQRFDY